MLTCWRRRLSASTEEEEHWCSRVLASYAEQYAAGRQSSSAIQQPATTQEVAAKWGYPRVRRRQPLLSLSLTQGCSYESGHYSQPRPRSASCALVFWMEGAATHAQIFRSRLGVEPCRRIFLRTQNIVIAHHL